MKHFIFTLLLLISVTTFSQPSSTTTLSQKLDCCTTLKEVAESLLGTWKLQSSNNNLVYRYSLIEDDLEIDEYETISLKYEQIDIKNSHDEDDFLIADINFYNTGYGMYRRDVYEEGEGFQIIFLDKEKLVLVNDLGRKEEYIKIKDD